jgi:hypothetical protein
VSPDAEELARAVAHARDRQFADLIVLALGLACETHPEMVRDALAKVFDMKAATHYAKQVSQEMMAVQKLARSVRDEIRQLLAAVNADFDAVEKRFDAINYHLETQNGKERSKT